MILRFDEFRQHRSFKLLSVFKRKSIIHLIKNGFQFKQIHIFNGIVTFFDTNIRSIINSQEFYSAMKVISKNYNYCLRGDLKDSTICSLYRFSIIESNERIGIVKHVIKKDYFENTKITGELSPRFSLSFTKPHPPMLFCMKDNRNWVCDDDYITLVISGEKYKWFLDTNLNWKQYQYHHSLCTFDKIQISDIVDVIIPN